MKEGLSPHLAETTIAGKNGRNGHGTEALINGNGTHSTVNGNGHHENLVTTSESTSQTTNPNRKLPPVRLSTYDNHDGQGLERMAPYLDALAGKRGRAFVEAVRRGRVNDLWRRGLDRAMYKGIRENFGLDPSTTDKDTGKFYKKSLQVANEATERTRQTLFPGSQDVLGQMNELDMVSSKPHLLTEYAAIAELPRLKQEIQKSATTAIIAGKVVAELENSSTDDCRAEMQRLFGQELFTGPIGHVVETTTYTQHDNNTNEVVWVERVDKPEDQKADGIHWRVAVQDMRPVEGIGLVETYKHDKDPAVAVIKSIRKAQFRVDNGKPDIIDPNYINEDGERDVEDYFGATLVVLASNNHEEERVGLLQKKAEALVQQHFGDRLVSIRRKNKNGAKYPGQSNKVRYNRSMFLFEGEKIPVEVMFISERYYRNTQTDIGEFNPEKNKYSGLSHDTYDLQRLIAVQPRLLPQAGMDIQARTNQTLHAKANEIREKGRVQPPEHLIYHRGQ